MIYGSFLKSFNRLNINLIALTSSEASKALLSLHITSISSSILAIISSINFVYFFILFMRLSRLLLTLMIRQRKTIFILIIILHLCFNYSNWSPNRLWHTFPSVDNRHHYQYTTRGWSVINKGSRITLALWLTFNYIMSSLLSHC